MAELKDVLRKVIATEVAAALMPTRELLGRLSDLMANPPPAASKTRSLPRPEPKAAPTAPAQAPIPAPLVEAEPRHPRSWLRPLNRRRIVRFNDLGR